MKTKRKAEAGASIACLEAALLCAPMGVVITDETGRIRCANPKAAALYGAPSVEALAGLPAIPAEDALAAEFAHLLAGPAPARRRLSGQTPFNQALDCECTMAPICAEGAEPEGMIFFFAEDAAADHVRQDLIQAEKLSALENVIAGVAHEMNNPLTAILGYAELLLSQTPESTTRHRLASIAEEAERCRKIVSNLMIFCTHHRRPTAPVDVNGVLEEVAALCGYQMRVSNVKLELDLERGLPTVSADAHELEKVFLNLIVNAHQALKQVPKETRRLRIGTRSSGGMIRITFADSGPGIPPSIRHRVFDPFFSTKPLGEGMGLGLSVAHGVAQEYGGRIWVESTEGEGTTFILELPAGGALEGF